MAKTWVRILGVLLTALWLVGGGLSPALALGALLVGGALVVSIGARVGWWVPLPAAALYGGVGMLVHGVNFFAVCGMGLLASLAVPLCLRRKLSLLGRIGVAALVSTATALALVGIWAAASGCSPYDVIPRALMRLRNDPVVWALAKRFYRRQDASSLSHDPLSPLDALYEAEVMQEYAYAAGRELQGYLVWYLGGYAMTAAGVSVLGGAAISQACGRKGDTAVADVRLGRWYLIVIAACLLFAACGVIDALRPATVATMQLFVMLPTALCGVTLLCWTVRLARGKLAVVLAVLLALALVAALVWYEWGLIVLGFLGLGDIVLDMRKRLTWALSDGA